MNFISRYFASEKVLGLALIGYVAAAAVSRTFMDSFGWYFVLFALFSVPFLWKDFQPKENRRRLWGFALGFSYFVFNLGGLLSLKKVDLPHLVFVDVFFILVPLVLLLPNFQKKLTANRKYFERVLEAAVLALFLTHVLSCLVSVYQVLFLGLNGARGLLGITISFAYNHLFSLILILTLLKKEVTIGRFGPAQFFILSCVILLSLLLSASRTASMIGLLFWLWVVLPWLRHRFHTKGIVLAVVGLLMAGSILTALNPTFRAKYTQVVERVLGGKDFRSLKSREFLWVHNKNLFLEHPLLGVGYRQNIVRPQIDFPQEIGKAFSKNVVNHLAHNLCLQSLAEGGLIGTALLFSSLAFLFLSIESSTLLFLGLLLSGLSDSPLSSPKMFHPFYASLLFLGVLAILRSKKSKK